MALVLICAVIFFFLIIQAITQGMLPYGGVCVGGGGGVGGGITPTCLLDNPKEYTEEDINLSL